MKKIISLFQRNYEGDRQVRDEVTPGAEWVIAGEGVATRKWDGCCCMIRGGEFFRRFESKNGKQAPAGFEPAQEPDPITGDVPGWVPVGIGPEDKWFRAAYDHSLGASLPDGTYEAIGQHFQGNAECRTVDMLTPHGKCILEDVPRTFDALREYLLHAVTVVPCFEGIVWHHPDGRMVKIKARDFGYKCKKARAL